MEDEEQGDRSMMEVESEADEYDSIFALIEKSDDDEDDDDEIASIEHERDDLLVVVVDLKETIEELKREGRHEITQKGKEVASEAHIKVENELQTWTWSSDAIAVMYTSNSGNRQGVRFQREKTPYNPHSMYVTVYDNWICTHCGNTGHFKENYKARIQSQQKNKGAVKGSIQKCLLSVFQIRDKGNKVEFVSKICTITNLMTGEVALVAKRYKNIYVADFESLQNGDLSCLSVVDDDAELWHIRLDHASFTLLNKLVKKDLVKMSHNVVCIRCMIRSVLNKTQYELLNGRKPKLTHVRTFGYKCFVLNNGKEALGKFDAKSNEGIFSGYLSQRKAYKVYNKRTQCVEESIHVIFDESHHPCGKDSHDNIDQDGEQSVVLGEVIDMANGKADMMSQVKESNDDGVAVYPTDVEKPEEVFVKQSPGFECHEYPDHVFKLDKALYGLKQAPRPWYERFSKFLLENGFTRGKIDNTLFLKKRGRNLLIVQVYVDDIIFGATNDSMYEEFARLMGSEFEMSMMGELNFFLGLQVKQTLKGTLISQQKYIKELLKRFEMKSSKIIDTLIATDTHLDLDKPGSPVNETMYRGIIGSLLYLTASKPDIVFSVGLYARFQSNPKESLLKAAKRILKYLKGMQDLVLYYPSGENFDLVGYVDADYAVAQSTTEAEYVVVASCCAQFLWIKQQLEDFGVFYDCVPLLCDNTSTLNMAKNPVQHKRTKHIDVRHHFLKDNVEKRIICMKFCSTEDQITDIFTKALNREHFEKNRLALGLIKSS
ncbi:uncharacterized protein LOC142167290 [Nicotiana tabacum]|uniref:Uncharacterized protein LOC142167290 n=1 Tax=Nicotiana tabacum TaxID=4097 RepID=A0AC58SF03_TOBAC